MLVLFTDFGLSGPYLGQVQAVLYRLCPEVPVLNLFADAPIQDPALAGYLLAAYSKGFETGTVFLCVVDPGVGGARRPVYVRADGYWFVGPDNGLFDPLSARAEDVSWWEIVWRPEQMSKTFHGRDLFAPVAGGLALGIYPDARAVDVPSRIGSLALDRYAVIYFDHYGNAITGIRAGALDHAVQLLVGDRVVRFAPYFSAVSPGELFWFENSSGLIEIAVNRGRADSLFNGRIGEEVRVVRG